MDYMYRPDALVSWNVYDYYTNTYQKPAGTDAVNQYSYQKDHPQRKTMVRVIRASNHNWLLKLMGRRIPRNDIPQEVELYCATVLMLVKPWRQLSHLREDHATWKEAFDTFMMTAHPGIKRMLENIQDQYRSADAAEDDLAVRLAKEEGFEPEDNNDPQEEDEGEDTTTRTHVITITEEMIERAENAKADTREERYAMDAMTQGYLHGVFEADEQEPSSEGARTALPSDVSNIAQWQELMDIAAKSGQAPPTTHERTSTLLGRKDAGADVARVEELDEDYEGGGVETAEEAIQPVKPDELLDDQRRAYDIITSHLTQTILAREPDQLLMQIQGEGGTGKSKVIQTVTQFFAQMGMKSMLMKMAYTGIAASLIEGKTTHTATCMSVSEEKMSAKTRRKLTDTWREIEYVIIDEVSMLSRTFLAALSKRIAIGKARHESNDKPFGGVNVIICGDFHQFGPVVTTKRGALYHISDVARGDSAEEVIGRSIYEQFDKVVILKEQVRVQDAGWRELLSKLRYGEMHKKHYQMLKELTLGDPQCPHTDFTSPEWENVCLVTPRHSVRTKWNDAAVRQHCKSTGERLYICPAENTVKGQPLTMKQRLALAEHRTRETASTTRTLPGQLMLAKGMKVMVTLNIHTDLDIANGTRGEIVAIVLDPNEPEHPEETREVQLHKLPLYVLVKVDNTRLKALPGLERGIIPLAPVAKNMKIGTSKKKKKKSTEQKQGEFTVTRRQLPMTAAYAFTDYRAQGQTIPKVVVDIAHTPSGQMSIFNAYVALSRSRGRSTIRLLRKHDPDLFKKELPHDLIREDERLEALNVKTHEWWERQGKRDRE